MYTGRQLGSVAVVRRRRGLRGLGATQCVITANGARVCYDSGSPVPGGSSAPPTSYLAPPSAPATQYPDGTYVHRDDTGETDVVRGGYRYWIGGADVGDALGGGWRSAISIPITAFLAIPFGGTYALHGNNIVITDPSGNVLSIEPASGAPSAPAASTTVAATAPVPNGLQAGAVYDYSASAYVNPDGTMVYAPPPTAAQTSYVPTTSPAAVVAPTSTTSSALSSIFSSLPSWWPYAAIGGVALWMFSGRKGRR